MCENVRAITAIKYSLEQLNKFYNDLSILDKYTDDYEEEYNDLLDNTERLRAHFSALYARILNENNGLKEKLDKENTELDTLKFLLDEIINEQEIMKNFEGNAYPDYQLEILLIMESTENLLKQYRSVREHIRWDIKNCNEGV